MVVTHILNYQILGTTLQCLYLELQKGEKLYSETGAMLHMTDNVNLSTNFKNGIGGAIKRIISGNSIALNEFEAINGQGEVSFVTRMPGQILPLQIQPNMPLLVQRHSFLCAEQSVDFQVAFSWNLFGLFGGNGLVFNQLSGQGKAFVSIDGEILHRTLQVGESMLVHPAHLAVYDGSIQTEVRRMRGVKNLLFGNDGLALVKVTGPGNVWLHTLSIHNLAELLSHYMPTNNTSPPSNGLNLLNNFNN